MREIKAQDKRKSITRKSITRKHNAKPRRDKEIVELYLKGKTYGAIMDELDQTYNQVRLVINIYRSMVIMRASNL